MKFIALQNNITRALNQVGRAVGTKATLPVLSNILISAEKGKIHLAATDLEVAITTQAIGKVEKEGKITIPARLLIEFIGNNNDESIDFETNELTLNLKSSHYKASIKGISADEFPTIPLLPKDLFCTIKKNDFVDAVKKALISPANDETRPVLAGVYFSFENKTLTIAATDSYRLSEKKLELDEEVEERKFIVPAKTMSEVLRLLSGDEGVEKISISSTENQILFQIGETQVISRLIEGAFPNYAQIIPAKAKIKAKVDFNKFSSAIKMAALFARNSANNIKIKVSPDQLTISSMAGETGESTGKMSAETEGGELEIAFNVKYVSDVLPVIQNNKVLLEFNDDASAGAIKSPEDKNFVYIVMPLKMDS